MNIIDEVAAERRRQIEEHGCTPQRDDGWENGEMANTAGVYALGSATLAYQLTRNYSCHLDFNKPRRRQLVIAAALIVAEIERLDRAERAAPRGGGE